MKKILLIAMAAMFAWTASAQDKTNYGDSSARMNDGRNRTAYTDTNKPDMETRGRWAVGPQFGIYTNTEKGGVFGVGAIVRYDITQRLRVQPAIMALCKKDCSVDITGDLQYLFRVARWWTVYPQVGVGGNDFNGWSFAVDLGVGTDFAIARRWDLTAAFKWMVQTHKDYQNPMLISIGAAYRF